MATAMKCNGGVYRVEDGDSVYIFDDYKELEQRYEIIGVITPSVALTFMVLRKAR